MSELPFFLMWRRNEVYGLSAECCGKSMKIGLFLAHALQGRSFNRSCSDCNNAVTQERDTVASKPVNH